MLFISFLFIFFYPRKKKGQNEKEERKKKEEGKYLGKMVIIRGIDLNYYGSCD